MTLPTNLDQVDVLIVGSGPAGLSTALSLHYHSNLSKDANIGTHTPPTILLVDALAEGQNESRALVVHARTMEALASIKCHEYILTQGFTPTQLSIQSAPNTESKGSKLFAVDFGCLRGRSHFPFPLVISQHETEVVFNKLLEERMAETAGKPIEQQPLRFERGCEVVDVEEKPNGARNGFLVSFSNGKRVWCQYLVGADGSRSIVRTRSQIPFEDPTTGSKSWLGRTLGALLPSPSLHNSICIADVIFTEDMTKKHKGMHNEVFMTFGEYGFFLYSPVKVTDEMRKSNRARGQSEDELERSFWYRFAFSIPDEEAGFAREMLHGSKAQNGNGSAEGNGHPNGQPTQRNRYTSDPRALEYIQKKVHAGLRYIPANPSEDDQPINPTQQTIPQVQKIIWASTFRIRNAAAETFHKAYPGSDTDPTSPHAAHVLLAGDAAHIHSPAGGQGMNLGIRDGVECGKAIATHWRKARSSTGNASASSPTSKTPLLARGSRSSKDSEDPLDEYARVRHAEALPTIALTKRLSFLTTLPRRGLAARLRDWFIWTLGRMGFVKKFFVLRMSGIGYRKEPIDF